ncbi:hypothetical protein DRQ20_02360 [bacterium]|nr:MAG: hypothetical protein DRQ20_02360 [bacterium]
MILLFAVFQLMNIKDGRMEILYRDDGKSRETIVCIPPSGKVNVDYQVEKTEGEITGTPLEIENPGFFRRNRILILRVAPGVKRMRIHISFPDISGSGDKDPADAVLEKIAVNGREGKGWKMEKLTKSFNSSIFTGSGLKILTSKDAPYMVTYRMLEEAGFPVDENPQNYHLYCKGREIPIYVKGEEDGKMDPGDYIIFPGERPKGDKTWFYLHDTCNAYILVPEDVPGLRFVEYIPSPPGPPDTIETSTLHFEEDSVYEESFYLPYNWVWRNSSEGEVKIEIPGIDTSCASLVRLTFTAFSYDPVEIFINGISYGSYYFSRYMPHTVEITLPPGRLQEENTIRWECEVNVALDWIEVDAGRKRLSNGYYCVFKGEGGKKTYRVDGFLLKDLMVVRKDGYMIRNVQVEEREGRYSIIFSDTIISPSTYYVFSERLAEKPSGIEWIEPPEFLSPSFGKEVLVVTAEKLLSSALRYKSLRESIDSLEVAIATVEDIANVFYWGRMDSNMITPLLRYGLENWDIFPLYLVILGKGTYDERDILKTGENIVPAKFMRMEGINFPIDYPYSFVTDDRYPDIFIGRIPATTVDEADGYVEKIESYELTPSYGPWRTEYVFLAGWGHGDNAQQEFEQFVKACETAISGHAQFPLKPVRIYQTPDEEVHARIINEFDHGAVMFIFHGHGGRETVFAWQAFATWDIPKLRNYGRLPFLQIYTCLPTGFEIPGFRSIGEYAVIFPQVGAIGVFGPTGYSYPTDNTLFTNLTLYAYRRLGMCRLGEIIFYPKLLYPGKIGSYFHTLLGDPVVKLPVIKEEGDLEIFPGGDSLLLSIHTSGTGNGVVVFEDTLRNEILSFPISIKNGICDTTIPVPESLPVNVWARVYAHTDSGEFIFGACFSPYGPFIGMPFVIPSSPAKGDTVKIGVRISDPGKGVCLWYKVKESSDFVKVYMYPSGGDTFMREDIYLSSSGPLDYYITIDGDTVTFRSPVYSVYVRGGPDLDFIGDSIFFELDSIPCLSALIRNSGESDACNFGVSFFIQDPESGNIFLGRVLVDTLPSGSDMKVSIPWNGREGRVTFLVVLDDSEDVVEEEEFDNTLTETKAVPIFHLLPARTRIWHHPEGYISVRIESLSVAEEGWFMVRTLPYSIPENEDGFSPGYFDGVARGFEISWRASFSSPPLIIFHPDTSGEVYHWFPGKWVKEKDCVVQDSVLFYPETPGIYTIGTSEDKTSPYVSPLKDTVYTSTTCSFEWRIEDEDGIDVFIQPPRLEIDGEEATGAIILPDSLRNTNLIPLKAQTELDMGEHEITLRVYDVHGNLTEKTWKIRVFVPYEIEGVGNYPNPCRDYTDFAYTLSRDADKVKIEIFTRGGRRIVEKELSGEYAQAGYHVWRWYLVDENGNELANGLYFYRITAYFGGIKREKRMKLFILKTEE